MADLPKTMQAVVLTQPEEWELQEVPTPQPEGTDVICRVHSVAICGTDPNIIRGAFPGMWPSHYPFIIGHEWAGEVVAIAPEAAGSPAIAKRFAVGTRVAGEAHCGCGICANCLVGDYTICSELRRQRAWAPPLRLHHPGRIRDVYQDVGQVHPSPARRAVLRRSRHA